ncbi:hypothetical protein E0Z10_g9549 [Xylaria hypoxylon]|uniref:Uncharacterized protein n=1 Tax=Xylaria hypoxylon TaxID=37992 RepID=A0A4Z0YGY1_9PEZI|nr:hypothetical protein E0Z10_g9549 [Xylaria hypoxylon]
MASGNDNSPLDAELKDIPQSAKNHEDNVTEKQEDNPNPIDDSHRVVDQGQGWKMDKNSWKAWWNSHQWSPFKGPTFLMRDREGHDKVSLTQNTQIQPLPATTVVEALPPHMIEGNGDSEIAKAMDNALNRLDGKDIPSNPLLGGGCCQIGSACSLDGYLISLQTKRDSTSPLSKNDYTPPSAHTVTATSSTKSFKATKIDEIVRSIGPKGIRPGFGFSSIPTLKEGTLGAAVAVAWIAAWRYL